MPVKTFFKKPPWLIMRTPFPRKQQFGTKFGEYHLPFLGQNTNGGSLSLGCSNCLTLWALRENLWLLTRSCSYIEWCALPLGSRESRPRRKKGWLSLQFLPGSGVVKAATPHKGASPIPFSVHSAAGSSRAQVQLTVSLQPTPQLSSQELDKVFPVFL